jgi:hypothetical protein
MLTLRKPRPEWILTPTLRWKNSMKIKMIMKMMSMKIIETMKTTIVEMVIVELLILKWIILTMLVKMIMMTIKIIVKMINR